LEEHVKRERPRGYAPEFRSAFLNAAATVLAGVSWQDVSDYEIEYPERSLTLGRLWISFGWDDITVHVEPYHCHFQIETAYDIGCEAARVAGEAAAFVNDLVNDRVVVRWGRYASRAKTVSASPRIFNRIWRTVTPWVREARWSGKVVA
jgi:hypothetical protein